jgi:hypothetical protein
MLAPTLDILMVKDPAATAVTETKYELVVAPDLITTTGTSVALTALLFTTNVASVPALRLPGLFIVIVPHKPLIVTAVFLLVNCVTALLNQSHHLLRHWK